MALNIRRKGLKPRFSLGLGFRPGPDDFRQGFPLRKNWIVIGIVAAMDAVFTFPAVSVFQQAVSSWSRMEDLFDLTTALFTTGWLLGWSLAPLSLTAVLLLMLFGREVVCAGRDRLCVFFGLPGIGLLATYRLDAVRNLRLERPPKKSGKSWRGPFALFDYGANTGEFGIDIDEFRLAEIRSAIELAGGHTIRTRDATAEELAGDWPEPRRDLERLMASPGDEAPARPLAPVSLASPSTIVLILANLVPLVGAVLFDWNLAYVLVLYWAESAVIGLFNLAKMWVIGRWLAIFMGLFFVGHFGAFMAIHFLFLYGIFIEGMHNNGDDLGEVWNLFGDLWPALAALFFSHGFSFFTNYIGRGEFRGRNLQAQMGEPYARIVFMHLVIIFGGGLVLILGDTKPVLLLVIVAKIAVDIRGHIKERGRTPSAA